MPELIAHGKTGSLFAAGSSNELAAVIDWAFSHPELLKAMRQQARREFELKYTAQSNYATLLDIYQSALDAKTGSKRHNTTSFQRQAHSAE